MSFTNLWPIAQPAICVFVRYIVSLYGNMLWCLMLFIEEMYWHTSIAQDTSFSLVFCLCLSLPWSRLWCQNIDNVSLPPWSAPLQQMVCISSISHSLKTESWDTDEFMLEKWQKVTDEVSLSAYSTTLNLQGVNFTLSPDCVVT